MPVAKTGWGRNSSPRNCPARGVPDARPGLIPPGFEDAHLPFRMGAVSLLQVDLQPAESVADLRGILDRWQRSHPDAEWIVGRGGEYGGVPGGKPGRAPPAGPRPG